MACDGAFTAAEPARSCGGPRSKSPSRAAHPVTRGFFGRGQVACLASDAPCRTLSPVIEPQGVRAPGPPPPPPRQRQWLSRSEAPGRLLLRPITRRPGPVKARDPKPLSRPHPDDPLACARSSPERVVRCIASLSRGAATSSPKARSPERCLPALQSKRDPRARPGIERTPAERRVGKRPKPASRCREVTLSAARLPSPDVVSGYNRLLRSDVAEGCRIRGSVDWLSPRRAPPAAISRAGAGQTPIQRASDTCCRVLVVLPAEEAGASGRGVSLESRFGVSRNEASCAHDPFTSPPGFRSRSSDPTSLLSRSSPPDAPACAGHPAEGRLQRSSAKKSAVGCTQGAFHRGATHRLGERLRAALPARAHRLAGRLGGSPQVVPNLWICACAFSSPACLALPDGARRTPRLGHPPSSFS